MPTGTITFLFTDIEGSTKLWEGQPEAMRDALARHDGILRATIGQNDGHLFKTAGDAFCAAFHTATSALKAALESQKQLQGEKWPGSLSLKVRMGIHTGAAELRDNDYFGQPLNRVARLMSVGHGGQVLLSGVTYDLCRDHPLPGATMIELGEHRLKDLGRPESVFQLCHEHLSADFPTLRSLEHLPNNLPNQLTSFVGRESEVQKIRELLGRTRLLTLTGSGGCGKTRLSLQVAAEVLDGFRDGVWFVEFAALSAPELVPQAVAEVFGLKDDPRASALQRVKEHLREQKLVLVFDNCEHVLDVCARMADEILHSCPQVTILASSREGLGISGEATYRVPSMSLPSQAQRESPESLAQYEAVRLFIDRAIQNNPSFLVTNDNAPAVASVCQRLDGIPLAIELAAARLRFMSVEEVNERLDQRFRLLTGGSRTALPRQQTLRSLIDWSYDLLNPLEKQLLCRLAIFSGGWTMEAAQKVCVGQPLEDWEILDGIASLTDKSLVVAEEIDGVSRYRLLETVRQYATERMLQGGEAEELRDRHLDYFGSLIASIRDRFSTHMLATFAVVERELPNLRAALAWSLEGTDRESLGLAMAARLYWFWYVRGNIREGREWLGQFVARCPDSQDPLFRAWALTGEGMLAGEMADYAPAMKCLNESLAIYRGLPSKPDNFSPLIALGIVTTRMGDIESAKVSFEERRREALEEGNHHGVASALANLAEAHLGLGEYTASREAYEEARRMFRDQGRPRGVAFANRGLGFLAIFDGAYEEAEELLSECLSTVRSLGDRRATADALVSLGHLMFEKGQHADAWQHFLESYAICSEISAPLGWADCLEGVGLLASLHDPALAGRVWGASERLREWIGSPAYPDQQRRHGLRVQAVREAFGHDARFDSAWQEGQGTTPHEAMDIVGKALATA